MKPEDLYDNVIVSLIRHIDDFRTVEMPGSNYVNWDAHATIGELPETDIIGLAGVGMSEDEPNIYEIMCGIAVSTQHDVGLARLTGLMSKLRGKFTPGTKLVVYDHVQVAPDSYMVCATPLAVTPVGKAETRPVQSIEVRLLLSPGAPSR